MTHTGRVFPFGDPRIKGCSPLPAAYRSVLRPSSPLSAKASTKCPYLRLIQSKKRHAQRQIPARNCFPLQLYSALLLCRPQACKTPALVVHGAQKDPAHGQPHHLSTMSKIERRTGINAASECSFSQAPSSNCFSFLRTLPIGASAPPDLAATSIGGADRD
jgi:hypothetical protein